MSGEQEIGIGDRVKWTSQSRSYRHEKEGVVVAVIRPSCSVREADGFPWGLRWNTGGYGGRRSHKSYAVDVNGRLYWPRTCHVTRLPEPTP